MADPRFPALSSHFERQGLPSDFLRLIPDSAIPVPLLPWDELCYVIQSGERGPVKIGVARNPDKRLVDLQVGNPVKLRILLTLPGGYQTEAKMHRIAKDHHILGEWFAVSALETILKELQH